MDSLGMAMAAIKRLGGYDDAQVRLLFTAGEKRLLDLKAFVYGGVLSDGTPVPGQKLLYEALIRQANETKALREEVAKVLLAKSATPTGGEDA